MFRSLIKNNLLTEINAPRQHVGLGWRQDDDGTWIVARITDEGLRAIGIDPNEGDAVAGEPDCSGIEGSVPDTAPTVAPAAKPATQEATVAEAAQATPRTSLRDAAAAVLAAWDDEANREGDMIGALDAPMEALRTLLAGKPARAPLDAAAPRKPREGTKQEQVLAMLRRPEGATVAQIAEATGWAQHKVRGFFVGQKKGTRSKFGTGFARSAPTRPGRRHPSPSTHWPSEALQPQHRTASKAPGIIEIPGALSTWLRSDKRRIIQHSQAPKARTAPTEMRTRSAANIRFLLRQI